MSTGSRITRRNRFFCGCEGASVWSFVTWLSRLCDENGLHLHLDRYDAGGGDVASVIRRSIRERTKRVTSDGSYLQSLVLVDSDRIAADRRDRQSLEEMAKGMTVIWLRPNLEGLLIRLHRGNETKRPQSKQALPELQRLWPQYDKSVSAFDLYGRFGLGDLLRAARHDEQLRRLLEVISLA